MMTGVHSGCRMEEVEALDAQAEGHDEGDGGVRVAWIKTKCTGVAGKRKATEVYEGRSELRDPPAKGSYYNKFVGGLRSGNNSELRATLRMCLSLLLFKWKWKVTSCNGCDLYLRSSAPLSLSFVPTPHGISFVFTRSVSHEFLRRCSSIFFPPKWLTEAKTRECDSTNGENLALSLTFISNEREIDCSVSTLTERSLQHFITEHNFCYRHFCYTWHLFDSLYN